MGDLTRSRSSFFFGSKVSGVGGGRRWGVGDAQLCVNGSLDGMRSLEGDQNLGALVSSNEELCEIGVVCGCFLS